MAANLYAQSELVVHYNRLNGDYNGWNLWVWNEGDKKEGFEVVQAGRDGYGAVFRFNLKLFDLAGKTVGLLPRRGNWEVKDASSVWLKKRRPARYSSWRAIPQSIRPAPKLPQGWFPRCLKARMR